MGVELEERVRRRRENDTGDQGRVAKEKTPHGPPRTDRRSIRFGQRFVYARGTSKRWFFLKPFYYYYQLVIKRACVYV